MVAQPLHYDGRGRRAKTKNARPDSRVGLDPHGQACTVGVLGTFWVHEPSVTFSDSGWFGGTGATEEKLDSVLGVVRRLW